MARSIEEDIVLAFDAALRALVPIHGLDRAWRRVGLCLAWVVLSRLGVLDAFRCFLCWNVAFVRKGLSDGLSWVGPDELSGLACKSV